MSTIITVCMHFDPLSDVAVCIGFEVNCISNCKKLFLLSIIQNSSIYTYIYQYNIRAIVALYT